MMPDLSFRRGLLYLFGITCLLVLVIYVDQQELWLRKLQGGSRANVSAHLPDDFIEGMSNRLREAVDEEDASTKKDDIKEGQVMTVGSKCSFI